MCALDTCKDSKRDTNAAINVLLQFNSLSLFITPSLFYYSTLCTNDYFTCFLMGVVCHITSPQIVPQDGGF